MNRKICEQCPRYVDVPPGCFDDRAWGCAIKLFKRSLANGRTAVEQNCVVPILPTRKVAPDWCEFSLEHAVTEPGEEVVFSHVPKICPGLSFGVVIEGDGT